MPAERYFTKEPLKEQGEITLVDQELHHLAHVMRSRVGETVELVNGRGALATAVIESLSKQQARLRISQVHVEPKNPFEVILIQAIPRINRLDFIIEKGTELGMTQLWLLPSFHSERKTFSESQMERFHSLSIAAMKQCGRLYLPEIQITPSLASWQKLPYPLFFGDLDPQAPSFGQAWKSAEIHKGVFFATGPESGFTESELAELRLLGGVGVRLNEYVLRTETASVMALSLIAHFRL